MSGNAGWVHVARKDLEDAARSKLFVGITGILVLLGAVLSLLPYFVEFPEQDAATISAGLLQTPVSVFLPVLGAIIGYMAIIQERDSGSIRVLMGLPLRRLDVIVGKTIGRSIVLVGALLIAGIVGVVLSLLAYGTVDGDVYASFGIVAVILSVVYVSLAIAISASVRTRGKALAGVVTTLLVFVYLWDVIALGIMRLVEGTWAIVEAPDYFYLILSLNPGYATDRLARMIFEDMPGTAFGGYGTPSGDVPIYLSEWVSIPILVLWIVVPLAIGYYRFSNADL